MIKRVLLFLAILFVSLNVSAQKYHFDVNGDKKVSVTDAMMVVTKIMGNSINYGEDSFCPDSSHPHIIDLGLPSGTKWVCCNTGANSPVGYGGYYAWGDTEERSNYTIDAYIHNNSTTNSYVDLGQSISGSQYDAPYVIFGNKFQIPSKEQISELIENCSVEIISINNINGLLFTGPNGECIFLPAAGRCSETGINGLGSEGGYWSGNSNTDDDSYAEYLLFRDETLSVNKEQRFIGMTIRPVKSPESLQLSVSSLNVMLGSEINVDVTSGSGNYTVSSSNDKIATVFVSESSINISTIDVGETTLTITDKETGMTGSVTITVTELPQDPLVKTFNVTTGKSIRLDDGKIINNSSLNATDFIPLIGGEQKISCPKTYIEGTATASFAFYTSNDEEGFIKAVNKVREVEDIPVEAKYFRMTIVKSATLAVVSFYGVPIQSLYDLLPQEGQLEEMEDVVYSPIRTTHPIADHAYIDANGAVVKNNTYRCSGFIELKGEVAIAGENAYTTELSTSVVSYISFYSSDSEDSFISAVSASRPPEKVKVPEGAKYVRLTAKPESNGFESDFILIRYGTNKQDIYDRINAIDNSLAMFSSGLQGKKVAFIGDSVTKGTYGVSSGKSYHAVFSALAGCTAINLGENSAVFVTNPSGGNKTHPRLLDKVTAENLSSVDMVVIFGGTNDFSYDSKPIGEPFVEEDISPNSRIGSKKRVPPSDTDTFCGAVHELILAVRKIIGEKPMLIMTPLNRGRTSSTTFNPNSAECNANGDFLSDYVETLKEIGSFYSIPVFETGAFFSVDPTQKTGTGQSVYFYDTLHPNDMGHARLGKLLYKFVANNLVLD